MWSPLYVERPARRPGTPVDLPPAWRPDEVDPRGYVPDPGLVDAVNVALLLGRPLLVTGEPGTGKTQLAYSIAWQLGYEPVLKFEIRSTTTATDLFYSYDNLGRFHAAYAALGRAAGHATGDHGDEVPEASAADGPIEAREFLTFNALGKAIIRAADHDELARRQILPSTFKPLPPGRSVVLIDEIDKAPRDLPNDILNEIDEMYFIIKELGNINISSDKNSKPVVVFTSNSEKNLPEPFLRRCVYYDIPFPDEGRLSEIIERRIKTLRSSDPLVVDAIELFSMLRDQSSGLRKTPGTAELLNWLTALTGMGLQPDKPLDRRPDRVRPSLCALLKLAEDSERGRNVFEDWLSERPA